MMCISNSGYMNGCTWEKYNETKSNYNVGGSLDGKTRTIYVAVQDSAGNVATSSATYTVYKECSQQTKVYTDSNYGTCSKTCGGGVQYRNYKMVDKFNNGKTCSTNKDSKTCNTMSCCSSKKVKSTGAWSACSKSCGGGTQTRTVTYVSSYDSSVSCGSETQSQSCNTKSCSYRIDFNNESILGTPKQKNVILINLLEDFKKLDLRPSKIENEKNEVQSDVLGDAFEYMIGEFASQAGKKAGSFFTPMMVSELMARIIKPQKKESIYDPTAGSGSLLIRSAKQAGVKDCSIFAQESNGSSYAMCRMNMFIHEIEHAEVAWGDSIADPKHLDYDGNLMKFDNIVANMPFSLDKWADGFNQGIENFKMTPDLDPYHRFEYGIPPSSKGDWAFLLHMIASLKDNGKMVAVIPHGVLFRGASEGKIRQKVVEQNLIDAIIGLPENLFFGTSIPAALLVIKKNRNNKDILFIDASKDYISDKAQNKLTQESIDKIIDTYENRKEIEKYSHLATFDEIKENDFNLNITRYIDTFEEEEEIDIDTLRNDIENTKKELNKVENELEEYLKDVLTQK